MPRSIDVHEVHRLLEAGAQLVEVLPRAEYDEEHLPGAVGIPLAGLDDRAKEMLDPSRPVVVYCWDSA